MHTITRHVGARFFTMLVGLTVASCGLLTPTTGIAEVVFDSIDFEDLNWSYGGVLELGSEIELSGSDRVVTMIEFLVCDVSSPRNVQLAIYSMDGPDGEPGTVLGTSNFVPAPLSEDEILTFSFDNVLVPDRITVTMYDDIPPGTSGTGGLYGPVSVGSLVKTWIRFSNDDWLAQTTVPDAVMMRIHAVPEPSAALGLCLMGMILFSRRRRGR